MANTGFFDNGGLVQFGDDNTSSDWADISLKTLPTRMLVSGDMPTDKTGVDMNCSLFSGTTPLFSATGTWQVQGNSTAAALKKNLKFKLKNSETDKKLKVKFGDWAPMSSITFKGYGVDRTLLRDSLSTALWRDMYSTYYNGLLAPDFAYDYYKTKNLSSVTSALFTTAGFPIELYNKDGFMGLYVIRSDVDSDAYLLDDDNPNHISTQPNAATDFWSSGQFDPNSWDIYSPADPTDATTQSIQRFISWAADCIKGNIDIRSTYSDYIDLKSFIDYILLCEVVASYDSTINNLELVTYDSKKWFVYPYDLDQTFGIVWEKSTVAQTDPLKIGWVMRTQGNISSQNPAFFELILDNFWGEIRDRYYFLRSKDILSVNHLNILIKSQVDLINPKLMKADLELWPSSGATGAGTGDFISDNGRKWSFVYIKNYFADRLKWLDQQFKI